MWIAGDKVAMRYSFGLKVIAEGVETKERCDSSNSIESGGMQDYYLHRSITIESIPQLVGVRNQTANRQIMKPALVDNSVFEHTTVNKCTDNYIGDRHE